MLLARWYIAEAGIIPKDGGIRGLDRVGKGFSGGMCELVGRRGYRGFRKD